MHKVLDSNMFKTCKGKLKSKVEPLQRRLLNILNIYIPMRVRLINKVTANPVFYFPWFGTGKSHSCLTVIR